MLLRSAIEHLAGLTRLSLRSEMVYDLNMALVLEIFSEFNLGTIRTLRLDGISKRGDPISWKKLQVGHYHTSV